jgi:hypothetical protein
MARLWSEREKDRVNMRLKRLTLLSLRFFKLRICFLSPYEFEASWPWCYRPVIPALG